MVTDLYEITQVNGEPTLTKLRNTENDEEMQEIIDAIETLDTNVYPTTWYQVTGAPYNFPLAVWNFGYESQKNYYYVFHLRLDTTIRVDQYGQQEKFVGLYCQVVNTTLNIVNLQGYLQEKSSYEFDDIMIYIKTLDIDSLLSDSEFKFDMYIGEL